MGSSYRYSKSLPTNMGHFVNITVQPAWLLLEVALRTRALQIWKLGALQLPSPCSQPRAGVVTCTGSSSGPASCQRPSPGSRWWALSFAMMPKCQSQCPALGRCSGESAAGGTLVTGVAQVSDQRSGFPACVGLLVAFCIFFLSALLQRKELEKNDTCKEPNFSAI